MTPDQMIEVAARGMCNHDDQRHRPLERRDGTPCRLHENLAWAAVEAIVAAGGTSRPCLDDCVLVKPHHGFCEQPPR